MRKYIKEDFEYYTDPKTGDVNCKILSRAAQKDGIRVSHTGLAGEKDDKAFDGIHKGAKDDYVAAEPNSHLTQRNPAVAKGVYNYLKARNKTKDITKKYNTNPKADVTISADSSAVSVNPDDGSDSYTIPMNLVKKYMPKEGDKKKVFPFFKKTKDPTTFKVAEERRRNMKRIREDVGAHSITYIYNCRISYQQYDISDRAFDGNFDDYVIYNSNYSFNPFKEVADAVETDFEEMGPTGLAQYISDYDGDLKNYVKSIIASFDPDKEQLFIKCELVDGADPHQPITYVNERTESLVDALKDYIDGQLSDGWGEGFEQQEMDSAKVYCAYNEDDESECEFYAYERDAENAAENNTYEPEDDDPDNDDYEDPVTWTWCEVNVKAYCSFYDHSYGTFVKYLIDGRDANGYDAEGYDKEGYNKYGRDRKGFDKEGYNASGFNKDGYDRSGFDRDGRDKDGFDRSGVKPMNNKRPTDKAGREQGAKFNVTKDGKVRIANTFDMGEAVKLSKKRVAEAKKIIAKNNKLTEAEADFAEEPDEVDTQVFVHIRGNDDWIALLETLGYSESESLITFDPSLIGGYFPLDNGTAPAGLETSTLAELQELPYPPNVITIVGDSPYIEDLDEWLSETDIGADESFEQMDMGEKAAEIAFNLSDIFESKNKRPNTLKEKNGARGHFGIEVKFGNLKYGTRGVNEKGELSDDGEPFEMDTEAEVRNSKIYKALVKKYGADKVEIVQF